MSKDLDPIDRPEADSEQEDYAKFYNLLRKLKLEQFNILKTYRKLLEQKKLDKIKKKMG